MPQFTRCQHASLARIAAEWWPVTGCSYAKLIERVLFALIGRNTTEFLDWAVFSYSCNRPIEAWRLYTDSLVVRGAFRGGAALHRALAEDIGLTPEQVAAVAVALDIPPPLWLAEWQSPTPSPKATTTMTEADPAPPRTWHDIVIRRLQERGSPARTPKGWAGLAKEVYDTNGENVTPDTIAKFGNRWLKRQRPK